MSDEIKINLNGVFKVLHISVHLSFFGKCVVNIDDSSLLTNIIEQNLLRTFISFPVAWNSLCRYGAFPLVPCNLVSSSRLHQ